MPPIGKGHGIGWDAVESISLAAAVSAYRLKSDRPFRRAWKLIAQLESDQIKSDWAIRLLFFQLRVLGSAPSEEACSAYLQGVLKRAREREDEHPYDSHATVLIDGLIAAFQMQGYDTSWSVHSRPEADETQFEKLADRFESFAVHRFGSRLYSWWMFMETPPKSLGKLYRSIVLEMMKRPAKERRRALSPVLDQIRLPQSLKQLTSSPFQLIRKIFHPRMMEETRWERERRERPLPLGFWIEPLIASATAYVKGVAAVDETVGSYYQSFLTDTHGEFWWTGDIWNRLRITPLSSRSFGKRMMRSRRSRLR